MRDPDASLQVREDHVFRQVRLPLASDHFLRSPLAGRWIASGRLVRFELRSDHEITAERLPFVSQPTEWCNAQLYDAARLTLDLQQEAVEQGFDLKDASAWNVLFAGTRPVFCDLLSFQPLTERTWWAAGQYARHFILPLALSKTKGMHTRKTFLLSRDGMMPEDACRLLGPSRFLTRFWPAMAGGTKTSVVRMDETSREPIDKVVSYRRGLHEMFSWMISGGRPSGATSSSWAAYREQRSHYPDGSIDRKRETMSRWLSRISPDWALDLGCNTGEFTQLCAAGGANVVAIDGDHDAVERLYVGTRDSDRIHPLIASLDDMSGGRGWEGREHSGLMTRLEGRFDFVMVLALIHHLIVSSSIPVIEVARFIWRCTRQWAVVEWIDEHDPQMGLLCSQRHRLAAEFAIERQREAFVGVGFEVVEEVVLHPGTRRLALLQKTA